MNTLFIFLDESGNLDFSPKGTAHFVLAAVTALQPIQSSSEDRPLKALGDIRMTSFDIFRKGTTKYY